MIGWIIGAALCAAGYVVGRARPLHRTRGWAIGYLLTLTPERASMLKMLSATVLLPDFIARGHRAERRRPKSLPAAPRLGPEWQKRADRAKQAQDTTEETEETEETNDG